MKNRPENSTQAVSNKAGRSSVFGASFNFINSIVGAGIIGMPFAIKQCGFFCGVALILFVAWLIKCSVVMLIECGIKNRKLDLELICEHTLGRVGFYVALLSMVMFSYGAQVAYLILVGDTVPLVAQLFSSSELVADRVTMLVLAATFIILPLCILRDLSSLSFTSLLSIIAVFVLIVVVASVAPQSAHAQHISPSPLTVINRNLFAGIGTMSFAFVCQHNSFMVFRSLKVPNKENWTRVARISLTVSFLLCIFLGLAGYLNFFQHTEADILNNFDHAGNAVAFARFLLAVCMIFTYPMECYVSRHCVMSIVNKVRGVSATPRVRLSSRQPSSPVSRVKFSPLVAAAPESRISEAPSSSSRDADMFQELDSMGSLGEDYNTDQKLSTRGSSSFLAWALLPFSWLRGQRSVDQSFELVNRSGHSSHDESAIRNPTHGKNETGSIGSTRQSSTPASLQSINSFDEEDGAYVDSFVNSPINGRSPERMKSFTGYSRVDVNSPYVPRDRDLGSRGNVSQSRSSASPSSSSSSAPPSPPAAGSTGASVRSREDAAEEAEDGEIEYNDDQDVGAEEETRQECVVRVVLTLLLWSSSLFLAIVVKDLGIVISLTGAVAASFLGYILPGLVFLQTYNSEFRCLCRSLGWSPCCVNQASLLSRDDREDSEASLPAPAPASTVLASSLEFDPCSSRQEAEGTGDGLMEISISSHGGSVDSNAPNSSSGSPVLGSRGSLLSLCDVWRLQLDTGNDEITASHFVLPLFLVLFGVLLLFLGVTTVILDSMYSEAE